MYIETNKYNILITNAVIPKKLLSLFNMKDIPDIIIIIIIDCNKNLVGIKYGNEL